ncbi:hypothetical protein AURDEDRAFT_166189 [Auricularia subglabra TFB-10046 SS5]|nr:hypothetical protein AURDEDRAFT_166189 [Auricularia subglabra TFB-10046 SS5]
MLYLYKNTHCGSFMLLEPRAVLNICADCLVWRLACCTMNPFCHLYIESSTPIASPRSGHIRAPATTLTAACPEAWLDDADVDVCFYFRPSSVQLVVAGIMAY